MSHLAKAPCTPSGHEKVDEIDETFCTICPVESGTRSLATDPLSPVCCQIGVSQHCDEIINVLHFTCSGSVYICHGLYECPFYPKLMKQKV